jgi:hypothetical protein
MIDFWKALGFCPSIKRVTLMTRDVSAMFHSLIADFYPSRRKFMRDNGAGQCYFAGRQRPSGRGHDDSVASA